MSLRSLFLGSDVTVTSQASRAIAYRYFRQTVGHKPHELRYSTNVPDSRGATFGLSGRLAKEFPLVLFYQASIPSLH